MKVCHWYSYPGSGMADVACAIAKAEFDLGIDSQLIDINKITTADLDRYADADVHVAHTHFPDEIRDRLTKPLKLCFVAHGTPDFCFSSAIENSKRGYGAGDSWMLYMHWLKVADARITFWERHQKIMESMVDNGTKVHCLPLGVQLDFWQGGSRRAPPFAGSPSVWSSENCHSIKAPYDLLIAWPWVYSQVRGACLHLNYLPNDTHRWYFPLINRNGASYGSHISGFTFPHSELRDIFKSVDFVCGLVRYGDFNNLSLQANASGAATISYRGNPYSSFWVDEGDQRTIADQLIAILRGEVKPREDKQPVPDIKITAEGMRSIYEELLNSPPESMVAVSAKLHRSNRGDRGGKRNLALRNHSRKRKSR